MRNSFFIFLLFIGCSSSRNIQMGVWIHDAIPEEYCTHMLPLKTYGIYRVISCEGQADKPECLGIRSHYNEYVSYCDPAIKDYLGVYDSELYELIKAQEKR